MASMYVYIAGLNRRICPCWTWSQLDCMILLPSKKSFLKWSLWHLSWYLPKCAAHKTWHVTEKNLFPMLKLRLFGDHSWMWSFLHDILRLNVAWVVLNTNTSYSSSLSRQLLPLIEISHNLYQGWQPTTKFIQRTPKYDIHQFQWKVNSLRKIQFFGQ